MTGSLAMESAPIMWVTAPCGLPSRRLTPIPGLIKLPSPKKWTSNWTPRSVRCRILTEKLRIDASSVWDSGGNKPGVTVNGVSQTFPGLILRASNCEVYGLLLNNFYIRRGNPEFCQQHDWRAAARTAQRDQQQ